MCSVVSNCFATPWNVAHQALLPMEFSRQEYWSRLPFPPPRDIPNTGIEPLSLLHWLTTSTTWEALFTDITMNRYK